ncbi:MAG: Fe-S protein assembly co-chaperone HscB [Gammaproteobacteria bacterium]
MTSGGDFFALFGLERSFDLDGEALSRRYRALQAAAHPDRFAGCGNAEMQAAQTAASRINDGYRTLKSPLLRAAYMLSLEGVDALAETGAQMSADFLMQQMEWRDALEELKGGDSSTLRAEVADAEKEVAAQAAKLLTDGAKLADEQKQQLADVIRRWRYIGKMLAEL